MPGNSRPSHKECTQKLRQAIAALEAGRRVIIDEDKHFFPDMDYLESASAEDHWELIHIFLREIEASGGAGQYTGKNPPYKCSHPKYASVELFAFSWDSPSAERKMYLKFGIRLNRDIPTYLYLNCHDDDPSKKNR